MNIYLNSIKSRELKETDSCTKTKKNKYFSISRYPIFPPRGMAAVENQKKQYFCKLFLLGIAETLEKQKKTNQTQKKTNKTIENPEKNQFFSISLYPTLRLHPCGGMKIEKSIIFYMVFLMRIAETLEKQKKTNQTQKKTN